MDEFIPMQTKKKNLNKSIQEFRRENPNYEIFNITAQQSEAVGVRFWVIWKLKN